jgi:hypothetical protein
MLIGLVNVTVCVCVSCAYANMHIYERLGKFACLPNHLFPLISKLMRYFFKLDVALLLSIVILSNYVSIKHFDSTRKTSCATMNSEANNFKC